MYCMYVCIAGELEASASDFSSGECMRRPTDPDCLFPPDIYCMRRR